MEFRDRIKQLRNEKNMSAIALAKDLNKSESAIRMWETDRAKPDADTLIELSKYFECTTDYLLGLSEFRNEKSLELFSSVVQKLYLLPEKDRNIGIALLSEYLPLRVLCPELGKNQTGLILYAIAREVTDCMDEVNTLEEIPDGEIDKKLDLESYAKKKSLIEGFQRKLNEYFDGLVLLANENLLNWLPDGELKSALFAEMRPAIMELNDKIAHLAKIFQLSMIR